MRLAGYHGNDCIVAGSRGFLRARLILPARPRIRARSRRTGINALTKAADFALKVAGASFPDAPDPAFPSDPPLR